LLDAAAELLALSDPDDVWAAVVDAEPEPRRVFRDDAALDDALAGFGDAADLKSPWFTGHSRGVARLARAAAGRLGRADAALVYRAGLVHDLGSLSRPASGSGRDRSGRRSGNSSACTPTTPAASWPAHRFSPRWA
jgi:HD-GYP domain-containing protein (c-di-GMP phosphodiesterase class II)